MPELQMPFDECSLQKPKKFVAILSHNYTAWAYTRPLPAQPEPFLCH
jgi:hypothetical protein